MKWYLIQLSMLIVCSLSAKEEKPSHHHVSYVEEEEVETEEEEFEMCPPKGLKPVRIHADKLLSGHWNYVKCTPSIFCNHLTCFGHKFEKKGFMTYSLFSNAFNMSAHKPWKAEGVCKARPREGRVLYHGTDHRANGDYYMLGTDYEHWWLLFCCLPDVYGVLKPAAWVASRDMYLKPSVEAAVKECMKKNGLDPAKFHSISDKSCGKYEKYEVAEEGEEYEE